MPNTNSESCISKVCRDSLMDALRYSYTGNFEKKKRMLGKSESFWDTLRTILFAVFIFLIMFVIYGMIHWF